MLSKRLYKFTNLVFPKLSLLGTTTWTWDPHNLVFVKRSTNSANKLLVRINATCFLGWIIFHAFQLFHYYKYKKPGFGILFTFFISFLIGADSNYLTVLWGDEWFPCLNALLLFLRRMNRKKF